MTSSVRLCIKVEDAPSDADVDVLPNRLEAFNECRWPGHQPWRPLGVFAREGETIVAGLSGGTYCGWLFIRYLWVSEALRGQGIGRGLMAGAEARAVDRGCHSAWVDTFSFQAPGFYPRLGYEVFRRTRLPARAQAVLLQEAARGAVRRGRLRAGLLVSRRSQWATRGRGRPIPLAGTGSGTKPAQSRRKIR